MICKNKGSLFKIVHKVFKNILNFSLLFQKLLFFFFTIFINFYFLHFFVFIFPL